MADQDNHDSDSLHTPRRRFFSWAIGVMGGIIGLALGIPILGYAISPALKREGKPWADAGPVSNLKTGEPTKVEYLIERRDGWIETTNQHSAWVLRGADGSLVAYDPRCTHLGCPYSWDTVQKRFFCPCHDAVFAIDGAVVTGPPPRPLDRYKVDVRSDRVMILEEAPNG